MSKEYTVELANELNDLWCDNEDAGMGEQAALAVACEMLGIPHEDAYDVLALIATEVDDDE